MKILKSIILIALMVSVFSAAVYAEDVFHSMDVVVQAGHVPGRIFDVSSDGNYIISNAAESPVVALLARDGTILRRIRTSLGRISDIAFLPGDERFVCAGSDYRAIEIWDLFGNFIGFLESSLSRVSDMEMLPDGKLVCYGSRRDGESMVEIWTGVTEGRGKLSGSFFASAHGPVAVHPAGLLSGVGLYDPALQSAAWSMQAPPVLPLLDFGGTSIRSFPMPENIIYITDLDFSPDGSRLYGAGHGEIVFGEGPGSLSEMYPGGLWYWDVETGTRTDLVDVKDGMDMLHGFAVTKTGNVAAVFRRQIEGKEGIYTYHEERSLLYLWDSDDRLLGKKEAKDPDINIVAGDEGTLFTLFGDGFRLYSEDLQTQGEIRCVGEPVPSVSVNGRGEVAAKRADGTIYVWDRTGGLVRTLAGRPVNPLYAPMQLFPDGGIMETFMEGYHYWGPGGRLLGSKDSVDWIRFETILSPLGYIARFGERGGVEVYDRGGGLLHSFAPAEDRWFLRFNSNGSLLGIFYYNGSCEIYDTGQWELQSSFSIGEIPEPNCVRISPGGDYVISLGYRGTADGYRVDDDFILNFTDGRSPVRTESGHNPSMPAEYHQVAISPNGGEFATAYGDMNVMIWDPRGKLVRVLSGLQTPCTSLTYSPDGRHIYAGGFDGSVRVWNRENGHSAVYYADGDDWLLYTDDGYFDASPRGGRLVRLVDGLDAYLPEQFGMFKNRPDIILERLELGSKESRRYFFLKYLDRLSKRVPVPARIPGMEFTRFLNHTRSGEVRHLLFSLYAQKKDNEYHLFRQPNVEEKYRLFLHTPFRDYVEKLAAKTVDIPKAFFSITERKGSEAVLDLNFTSDKSSLKYYNVLVNGVPLYPPPGREIFSKNYRQFENIELSPGENIVEVYCENRGFTESVRVSQQAYWEGTSEGDLYFVGLGVSDYRDNLLDLLYPAKDVTDMESLLRTSARERKGAFGETDAGFFSFTAVNGGCRKDITEEAGLFLQDAGIDDTVVFFISGHGMHTRDAASEYYFLTHEADVDNVEQTALPFYRLEDVLARCKARKKIMLMDTCESGELSFTDISGDILEEEGAGISAAQNEPRPRTIRGLRIQEQEDGEGDESSTGGGRKAEYKNRAYLYQRDRYINNDLFLRSGTVVFSSSRGGEVSYEPKDYRGEENGYFTGALLDSFSSISADADGDGRLSVQELKERVYTTVTERTGHRQNPTIDRDNPLSRIALPVVADLRNSDETEIAEYLIRIVESGEAVHGRLKDFLKRYKRETGTLPGLFGGGALVRAAELGNSKAVEILLAYGTDPGSSVFLDDTGPGYSAAARALEIRRPDIAELLIEEGAPVPPYYLITAKETGNLPRLRALLRKGRLVEAAKREAAVIEASWLSYWDVVEILLETGTDPNTKDTEGLSLLAAAVDQNAPRAAAMLLEKGADINCRDKRGNTPLIRAAGYDNFEMVRLLVESGAAIEVENKRGDTPLSEARRKKNDELYEYLRSRLED